MIIVDTSVWSLALRRCKPGTEQPGEALTLRRLIEADEHVAVPGIVLQELLSGIRERSQFQRLKEVLSGFPVMLATEQSHVEAARISNTCRAKGIALSAVDCLIAATAIEHGARLFTVDRDFFHLSKHIRLKLFETTQAVSKPTTDT